jgi:hypothetical protein
MRHRKKTAIRRKAARGPVKRKVRSAADLAGDLVGSLRGPGDLSTSPAHMRGFGEGTADRRARMKSG